MKVLLICALLCFLAAEYQTTPTGSQTPSRSGSTTSNDETCRLSAKDSVKTSGGSVRNVCNDYIRCCQRKCSPKKPEGKCVYDSESKFSPETYCHCKN